MTDDQQKQLQELHDYFMRSDVAGKPSRAHQIDEILTAYRTGKFSVRAFLWLCGAVIAVATAYSAVRGWGGK